MAAGDPARHASGAVDDRCGSFQGLQRHFRTPGRRPGAGRDRHLHLGFGMPGRRLHRALWGRGICCAGAGALVRGGAGDGGDDPAESRVWSQEPEVITVSIGGASLTPAATIDWTELVSAADKALYAAKAGG